MSWPALDGKRGHPLKFLSARAVAGRLGDSLEHRAGVAGQRRRVSVRGQGARIDVGSDALLVDCDAAVAELPELTSALLVLSAAHSSMQP